MYAQKNFYKIIFYLYTVTPFERNNDFTSFFTYLFDVDCETSYPNLY